MRSLCIIAIRGAVSIAFFAALPAVFAWLSLAKQEQELLPFEIATSDSRLSGDVVWVDARARGEFEAGHASGAVLLNEAEWDNLLGRLFEVWSPGRLIVVYCDAGCHASHKVAERIRTLGMDPVFVLKGGFDAWRAVQGKPIHATRR